MVRLEILSNKIPMTKRISMEKLAERTANAFHTVGKRFDSLEGKVDTLESTIKEGFGIVLDELRGLRDDVKQARGASSIVPLFYTSLGATPPSTGSHSDGLRHGRASGRWG